MKVNVRNLIKFIQTASLGEVILQSGVEQSQQDEPHDIEVRAEVLAAVGPEQECAACKMGLFRRDFFFNANVPANLKERVEKDSAWFCQDCFEHFVLRGTKFSSITKRFLLA